MRRLLVGVLFFLSATPFLVLAQTPNGPMGPMTLPGGTPTPTNSIAPLNPSSIPTPTATSQTNFSPTIKVRTLSRGMRGSDVTALQQQLIKLNLLAPDSATGFFGALTEAAVKTFQRQNNIVSSGTPATTGYGAVGPRTRAKLASLATNSTGSTYSQNPTGGVTPTPFTWSPTPTPSPSPYMTFTPAPSPTPSYSPTPTPSPTPTSLPSSCAFNGQTISHGASVIAYQTGSVSYGQTCISQTRTCTNGALSGTYSFSSCAVGTAAQCTWNNQSVANGESVTAYQSGSVALGQTCVSQQRTCSNGTLSGTYQNNSCSVQGATSCTFNNQTISSGASVTAYSQATVPYGSSCASVAQTRTCTNGTLSGTYTNASCSVATQTVTPWRSPLTMAQLNQKRVQDWYSPNTYWEVFWDGVDTPADNVPGPFMWDNPVDDDWFDSYTGNGTYLDQDRLNTPSRGFMTVDRTYGNLYKNGHIFTRDNWLDSNFTHSLIGLTLEVRVKLLPQSQRDSFFINYIGRDCSISVALSGSDPLSSVGLISPVTIRETVDGTPTNHIAMDTTSDFVTYRVVHAPGASTYSVYAVAYANENDPKPAQSAKLVDGTCDPTFTVANTGYTYPYIQIGDNLSAPDRNAAYIIDFIRYRRDAYTPTENLSSRQVRFPMALPSAQPSDEEALFLPGYLGSVSGGYFGDVPITSADVKNKMGESVSFPEYTPSYKDSGTPGIAQLTTSGIYSYAEVIHPKGLVDKGDFTIEARLKFLPDTGERGFRITDLDVMGAISLYFSKDKVETAMGLKPTGYQKVMMDTTDGFHTYRLVRKAGEMYAHLYIDNDPVPAITDARLSAEIETYGYASNPIIYFGGNFFNPVPFVYPAVKTTNVNVLIDYVRWYGYAFAPPTS